MAGDKLEFNGIVKSARGNGMFLIEISENKNVILCSLSGKIRQNNIRIIEGDNVRVEVSVYDLNKGRIVFREKS